MNAMSCVCIIKIMDERLNRKTPLRYICYYARMYKIINTVNITCFNFVLVNMWIIYVR